MDTDNRIVELAHGLIDDTVDGFTIELLYGEDVTTGYAVGGHPECPEVRISGVADLPGGLVAESLRFYAGLARLYGDGRMGGWIHEGDLYLDAPTIYFDGDDAEVAARDRGELAYFHIDAMTEHTVSA